MQLGERGHDDRRVGNCDRDRDRDCVTGAFNGTIDFGGGPLSSAPWHLADVFVAKYSPAGVHLLSKRYGGTSFDWGTGAASGPNGVVLTGYFVGTADFGSSALTSAGYNDGFLINLGP